VRSTDRRSDFPHPSPLEPQRHHVAVTSTQGRMTFRAARDSNGTARDSNASSRTGFLNNNMFYDYWSSTRNGLVFISLWQSSHEDLSNDMVYFKNKRWLFAHLPHIKCIMLCSVRSRYLPFKVNYVRSGAQKN